MYIDDARSPNRIIAKKYVVHSLHIYIGTYNMGYNAPSIMCTHDYYSLQL